MPKTLRRLITLVLPLLGGCAALFQPKTENPIPYQVFGDLENAERVFILMPGIRDRGKAFVEEGFIDIARPYLARHPEVAMLAVDAHWGYYRERNLHTRLGQDILDRHPDKRFTLVGISLGGFGALIMATERPVRIEQLILLAPFLGEDDYNFLKRLKTTGTEYLDSDDDQTRALIRAWRFLLNKAREIPVWLGYGERDEFVPYYQLLKSKMPEKIEMIGVNGGHDWNAWRELWEHFVIKTQP